MEGFDLEEEKKRVFPVDVLIDVQPYSTITRLSRKKILEKGSRQEDEINLVLELGPHAIAQYKKYHPLKSSISYTNPYQATGILRMFVPVNQPEELAKFVNWLLFLGEDIKIKEAPKEVWERLRERVNCLKEQLSG